MNTFFARNGWRLATCTLMVSAALSAPLAGAAVNDQDILQRRQNPWRRGVVWHGPARPAFQPADQAEHQHGEKLVPAWSFSFGGEKQRGQEAQPIIHDGVMYVTASYSRAYAVDARTGQKLWEYNARLPDGIMPCCDVINRGMAIYGDLVYFGTLDARLVALDRKTGKVVWTKTLGDYKAGYSYTRRADDREGQRSSPACPAVSSALSARWKPATPRPASWCGRVR